MSPKRVLPIVLALLMVVGLAACSTASPTAAPATGTEATTEAPATSEGTAAPPAAGPMDPYPEPVTISWAVQTAAASKLLDQDTWENNRWSRLIKERLNIDLKVSFTADSSTEAYRTKLNAVIASGVLPDIFKTQDVNVFVQLAENGSLADLKGVVEQYQTPELKAFMERYSEAVEGATIDGKLYAIPRANDNFHEAPFLWIRDDWLAYAGGQYPKTVDEMVEMARKFKTGDPDKNGKDGDTVGLGLNSGLIGAGHMTMPGLAAAYGVPGYGSAIFYRDKDGKMTFSWINPGMKPALELLNKMYKEGLINQDFTAKDEGALVEDVTSGKIGMAYGSNWGTWYPYNNTFKKDGTITRAYPVPTAAGYDYKVGIESNYVGQMTMVSADCKNPEAAVKILDLYIAIVGESQDNFNKYWNDEQYRLCPVYTDIPNENYELEIYNALVSGDASKLGGQAKPYYDLVVGFENGTNKDDNAYGTWGQMSKTGSLQWVINKYEPDKAVVKSALGLERPEIWIQNASVLETLTVTTFTDIITGAKPVDYFDTYVADWLKNGGQQTLDELDKLYPTK
jgi:putative aldouronate transport system substrate-binding protein